MLSMCRLGNPELRPIYASMPWDLCMIDYMQGLTSHHKILWFLSNNEKRQLKECSIQQNGWVTGPPDVPWYFTVYKSLSEWSFHGEAVYTPISPKQLDCRNKSQGAGTVLEALDFSRWGWGSVWVSTSPSRNSTALRLLCRLTGTEIKPRVLFAFHLAVCSCFHYRSASRILLPAENLKCCLGCKTVSYLFT